MEIRHEKSMIASGSDNTYVSAESISCTYLGSSGRLPGCSIEDVLLLIFRSSSDRSERRPTFALVIFEKLLFPLCKHRRAQQKHSKSHCVLSMIQCPSHVFDSHGPHFFLECPAAAAALSLASCSSFALCHAVVVNASLCCAITSPPFAKRR